MRLDLPGLFQVQEGQDGTGERVLVPPESDEHYFLDLWDFDEDGKSYGAICDLHAFLGGKKDGEPAGCGFLNGLDAWNSGLDTAGKERLSFTDFCSALHRLGYKKTPKKQLESLFKTLIARGKRDYLVLSDIDTVGFAERFYPEGSGSGTRGAGFGSGNSNPSAPGATGYGGGKPGSSAPAPVAAETETPGVPKKDPSSDEYGDDFEQEGEA